MPCLDHLAQVREVYPQITDMGARAIAVATGAVFQARRLMDEGMPFACLVDPEARLYEALGIGRLGWRHLLDPKTYSAYLGPIRHARRQGRITGDPRRLSGVALFDSGGALRWRHISSTIGDYPPVTEVLTRVRALADSPD